MEDTWYAGAMFAVVQGMRRPAGPTLKYIPSSASELEITDIDTSHSRPPTTILTLFTSAFLFIIGVLFIILLKRIYARDKLFNQRILTTQDLVR